MFYFRLQAEHYFEIVEALRQETVCRPKHWSKKWGSPKISVSVVAAHSPRVIVNGTNMVSLGGLVYIQFCKRDNSS